MQLYVLAARDTNFKFCTLRIDGGVSRNDFICQMLADLTQLEVERAVSTDMTALGACYLAGLNIGYWNNKHDLCRLRKVDKVFKPRPDHQQDLLKLMYSWERAVDRFKKWYDHREVAMLRKTNVALQV
jgi:putative glycerol kinase 5